MWHLWNTVTSWLAAGQDSVVGNVEPNKEIPPQASDSHKAHPQKRKEEPPISRERSWLLKEVLKAMMYKNSIRPYL